MQVLEKRYRKNKKGSFPAPFFLIAASAFAGFAGTNFTIALSVRTITNFIFCFHDL
jgi:hypothetical protein